MGSLYRKDVIDIALEQDGYQGNGKYCKYSKDLDAVNYFNMAPKNGSADWCSIFVNWCVYMSTRNLSGKIEPDKWDAHYFTFEPDSGENLAAGCGYAADYYMSHDAWSDDCQGACRGDQVFFRNFAHTGLVTGYDDEGIYTIEGNIDGSKVGRRYYKFDDPSIDGFGHIRYDGDEYPTEESEPDTDTNEHAYNCVDVSEHNGEIDWEAAKNDGVEYAFIRCGLGKYYLNEKDSEKKSIQQSKWEETNGEDKYFKINLENAVAAGIKVGVYFFSYAKTSEEATEEALQCISEIEKFKDIIDFPVFMDIEEKYQESLIKYIVPPFIETLNKAGYNCGVYTRGAWYSKYFRNIDCDYIWLAYWGDDNAELPENHPDYYDIWQYTSMGTVDGIGKNCVDCDILENTDMHLLINQSVPEPAPEPKPEPVQPPASSNQGTVYTVHAGLGSWLNVREEPSVDAKKIGELYDGAKVYVFEYSKDGWARIGDNMWVFADFLE